MSVMQKLHQIVAAEQQEAEVKDLTQIQLPLILKKKIIMAPGVWNGLYYSPEEIQKAFMNTDWDNPEVRSLFLDHVDNSTATWVGEARNVVLEDDTIYADLYIVDENVARKILFGAKFGISPTVIGDVPEGENVIKNFVFKNLSIVFTPAIKKAYINQELKKGDNMAEEEKKMNEEEQPQPEEVEEVSLSEMQKTIQELAEKVEALAKDVEELKKKKKKEQYPEPYGEEYGEPEEGKKKKKKNEEEESEGNEENGEMELQEESGAKTEAVEKIEVANAELIKKLETIEQKLAELEKQLVDETVERETIGGGVVIENEAENEILAADKAMLEILKVSD